MIKPTILVRKLFFPFYRNFYYLYHYYKVVTQQKIKVKNYSKYYQDGNLTNYDWFYVLGGYDQKQIYKLYYQSKIYKIHSLLSKIETPKLLDIGCGNGDLLAHLNNSKYKLFGIDISESAIKEAHRYTKAKLKCFDCSNTKLPFPDNYFNIITAFDLVEHLKSTKLFMNEIHRTLKPGGYFFIQTPDGVQTYDRDQTHINLHPQEYWLNLIRRKDFNIINSWRYSMYLPTPYLMIQKIIYFINYLTRTKIEQVVIIAQKSK